MYRQATNRPSGKFKKLMVFALLFLVVAVSSCGPSGTTQTPDFSLSASNVSIQKLTSGSASGLTAITITRTGGFSDAVNLSVSGLPVGVTSTFSDAAPTGGTSTLNLTVADTASEGTVTVTVTGTAGSANKTGTFQLTVNPPPAPTTITVSGKVTDIFGGPLNDVVVKIGTQVVNTNAQGQFSLANVTTPYDVKVVQSALSRAYLFKGLTRADPNLQLVDFGGVLGSKAGTINSNLSGGAGFPNPASHTTRVSFGAPEGFGFASPAGPAYTVNASWSGGDVISGTLHALQWQTDASGAPLDYKGYATKAQSLTDGGTINAPTADLALSVGVTDADLTGSVSLPAGYTLSFNRLYADFGTNQSMYLFAGNAVNFSYKTPRIPGATMTLTSVGTRPGGGQAFVNKTGIAVDATNATLTMPEISSLSLPIDAATGVTTTTPFNWTAFSGGVHIVFYSGGGRDYYVITQANSATIPDFSAEGLGLPPATAFSWGVLGMAPYATVDAATGPTGPLTDLIKALFNIAPENDGSYMQSITRTFTTAP